MAIEFDTDTHDFDDLAKKYRDFYAPAFEVNIDGENLLLAGMAIPSITVDTTIEGKADTCTFSVDNAYDPVSRDFQWLGKQLDLGKSIEVKMGYVDKLETVFLGLITSIDIEYPSDSMPSVSVTAMDVSFLMMKGLNSKQWENMKYSDVAEELGDKYCSKVIVDPTKDIIDTIAKNQMTDFHFLQYLAMINNYEFFVVGRTMYFRERSTSLKPVTSLAYGKNLRSFSTDMNLADQIGGYAVRFWDPKQQKTIQVESKKINKLGSNTRTGKDIMNALGNFVDIVYSNVQSKEEAQSLADALINEKLMGLVSGSGECIGIPELRAGRHIQIDGVGKKMNQPYVLTSARHTISSSGYLTSFQVEGNAF